MKKRPVPPDLRLRRRNEAYRMVEKPDDFDLTRSPNHIPTGEKLKAAVMAALVLGVPASDVAQQYNLPTATVERWHKKFDITTPIQRRDQLSEMLMEYVKQRIISLTAVDIITSGDEWVDRQNAHDMAALISVKQAGLVQVLEVFGRSQAHAAELRQVQVEIVE